MDECAFGTHNCSAQAKCTNTDGGFNCTCKTGYSGSGYTCQGKLSPNIFLSFLFSFFSLSNKNEHQMLMSVKLKMVHARWMKIAQM